MVNNDVIKPKEAKEIRHLIDKMGVYHFLYMYGNMSNTKYFSIRKKVIYYLYNLYDVFNYASLILVFMMISCLIASISGLLFFMILPIILIILIIIGFFMFVILHLGTQKWTKRYHKQLLNDRGYTET